MKLEEQVNSLEISKHLKELGVKQGSLFYWVEYIINEHGKKPDIQYAVNYNYLAVELGAWHGKKGRDWKTYSAFTVAELGEMLPENKTRTMKIFGYWYCELYDYEQPSAALTPCQERFVCDTEADALGKMLIYLLENKLIDNKSL